MQQLSALAIGLVAMLLAAPGEAQEWELEAASARVAQFDQDGRGTQSQADVRVDADGVARGDERIDVTQPALRFEVRQSRRVRHVVDVLVDVVSSASADALDAVATASLWNEAFTVSLESQIDLTDDDEVRVQGGAHLEEPLKGGFGSLGYRRSLAEDNASVDLRASLAIDAFDPLTPQGIDRGLVRRRTLMGSVGLTQLLSPTTVASVSYGLTYQWGVLQQTWNSVPVLGESYRMAEVFPGHRLRHALTAGLQRFLPRTRSTVDLGYRFYADDFGLRAHSAHGTWAQWLHRMAYVRVGYRLHRQSGVDFFTSAAPLSLALQGSPRTADSDLAAFLAHEVSLKLVFFTRRDPVDGLESFYLSLAHYWRPRMTVTVSAAGYERRF